MSYKGDLFQLGDRKILLIRGIFDYFNKNNFERLEEAIMQAEEEKAELYVGLYSDRLLKATNLSDLVKDEDRVFAVESLDFIDGAFIIDSIGEKSVKKSLKAKLYEQQCEQKNKNYSNKSNKKYTIGYASGAFSNLHKGHIEHLKEMH